MESINQMIMDLKMDPRSWIMAHYPRSRSIIRSIIQSPIIILFNAYYQIASILAYKCTWQLNNGPRQKSDNRSDCVIISITVYCVLQQLTCHFSLGSENEAAQPRDDYRTSVTHEDFTRDNVGCQYVSDREFLCSLLTLSMPLVQICTKFLCYM